MERLLVLTCWEVQSGLQSGRRTVCQSVQVTVPEWAMASAMASVA